MESSSQFGSLPPGGHEDKPVYPSQNSPIRLPEFAQWLATTGASNNTIRNYLSRVKQFQEFITSHADAAATLEDYAQRYLADLRQRDLAPSSMRCFCVALTSYCKFSRLKTPSLAVSAPDQEIRVLDPAQQQRLIEVMSKRCSNRDRAVLACMLFLGLRTGECVRADVKDIFLDNDKLFLTVRNESGTTDRIVPIFMIARQMLAPWVTARRNMSRSTTDALFISNTGDRIHANTVRCFVARIGDEAGLELSPQVLRNTFVANVIGKVTDGELARSLCGIRSNSRISRFTKMSTALASETSVLNPSGDSFAQRS
jgi:site-specific recombinase XerD